LTLDPLAPAVEDLDRPIRVFICALIRLYREGLVRVLMSDARLDVVGSAATPEDADDLLRLTPADVLLIDLEPPDSAGGLSAIRAAALDMKVLAVAVPALVDEVLARAEAGLDGFVTRDVSIDELVVAVLATYRGHLCCSPELAGALLRRVGSLARGRTAAAGSTLTARQRQIAALVRDGLSNKEIAAHLAIELPTVKNHVHMILEKLQLESRGDVARALSRY
jgi:two-component system nitrate/nitrite response regulator NarL